jgi:outer membrane protein
LRAGVLQRMLTSGAVVWALATPVRAETLEQALIEAYQNNPQLNSQRAVVRETDETVPQALSGYKPTVRVTGTVAQEYTSVLAKSVVAGEKAVPIYQRDGFGYSPNNVSATVTQSLYNGNQTANRVRLAESNTSAARETLRVAEQTILLNAATVYMDLLRDSALLQLQRSNVEVLQEQLRQTRDRFIVGEVTRTDVAQAETALAQGRAAVLRPSRCPRQPSIASRPAGLPMLSRSAAPAIPVSASPCSGSMPPLCR